MEVRSLLSEPICSNPGCNVTGRRPSLELGGSRFNSCHPDHFMKYCTKCNKIKPEGLFYKNKTKPNGVSSHCKDCQLEQQRNWYSLNRDRHKQVIRANNRRVCLENKQFIVEFLRTHPCVDCNEADPIVLEFDHVRGTKYKDISRMVTQSYSLETLKKEIAKCDVRCANCHRRITFLRMKRDKSGLKL